MQWKAVSEGLPRGPALILVDGACYVAVLVGTAQEPAFMELHTSDLLPWPSHWTELPPPPTD